MWPVFRRRDALSGLRAMLSAWYSDDETRAIVEEYRSAGPLADSEVASLARLGDGDRGRLLRERYHTAEARAGAAADFDRRAGRPGGSSDCGGCKQFLGDV